MDQTTQDGHGAGALGDAGHRHHRHQVVVIGSGFGGLFTVPALKGADVDITLIAKTTHHLFQPLLYQVATGILSEGEIAPSTREILGRQPNARVLLGEVTDIDLTNHTVTSTVLDQTRITAYDSLVVAAGSGQSYFGNDQFARFAPGMKSIDDALELRGRIFGSFEMAELVEDEEQRARLMTFVVVGAGPTGVEMAGQIAELAHRTLRHEFRHIDPRRARIILLDAAPSVLGSFGDRLGAKALARLDRIGVGGPAWGQGHVQGGRHAGHQIRARLAGKPDGQAFKYHDKGSMATISRFSAVASVGRFRLSGFAAWLIWLAVHLVYLIGFKNRLTTLLHWAVSFVGRGRSERTVTQQQIFARQALDQLGEQFSPTLSPRPGQDPRS